MKQWMIYGANGYTGKLIAEQAAIKGLKPILAGRRLETVRPLAERLRLDWRAFDLSRPNLEGVDTVLHCAGPFSSTSKPMLDACIKAGTNYLDITGEIAVFESIFARKDEIKKAGIVAIPGVGFDVVPSDCLAAQLKRQLPSATQLEMAMAGMGGISPGTMKSMLESMPTGGSIRKDGKIITVPTFHKSRTVQFSHKVKSVTAIGWGDVSTAYHSTGIPNITFYASAPKIFSQLGPLLGPVKKLTGIPAVQNFLKAQIDKRVQGPTPDVWETGAVHLWGRVQDDSGKSAEALLDVPEGYWFTMLASLKIVDRILNHRPEPGAYTPSLAFGADFIKEFPEAKLTWHTG